MHTLPTREEKQALCSADLFERHTVMSKKRVQEKNAEFLILKFDRI